MGEFHITGGTITLGDGRKLGIADGDLSVEAGDWHGYFSLVNPPLPVEIQGQRANVELRGEARVWCGDVVLSVADGELGEPLDMDFAGDGPLRQGSRRV